MHKQQFKTSIRSSIGYMESLKTAWSFILLILTHLITSFNAIRSSWAFRRSPDTNIKQQLSTNLPTIKEKPRANMAKKKSRPKLKYFARKRSNENVIISNRRDESEFSG